MLAANAAGTHITKPGVIGKHKSPRAFNQRPGEVRRLMNDVTYYHQENAWVCIVTKYCILLRGIAVLR